MLTKVAEVEHGKPIRPLGGGRARLPNGRCDASLVEESGKRGPQMVVVEVPHTPSECPIVLGKTGSKLSVEGLCNRLRAGVGFPSIVIKMFCGRLEVCSEETSSAWDW